jgi:ATP-binding cassette, subfamily B, bacterial
MWGAYGVDESDQLGKDDAKRVLGRCFRMLRPYRKGVILAGCMAIIWTLSILAGPFFVRYGIDHGITKDDVGALNAAVIAYVLVAALSYVVYRVQILAVSRVGEGFLRDLRVRVFHHLQRLSMPFYDREKAGVLVSRMTSDVDSLSELVQAGLLMMIMNVLLLVFSIVVLAVVSWKLLLICLVAVPFVVLASIKFQRDSNRAYLTIRDRIGGTLSTLQEGISGVRVIQAYGREDIEVSRFGDTNWDLYDAHMESVKIQSWYLPVIQLAGIGTTALVIGVGGFMVTNDVVTIGTVTFFILTLSNLFEPIQQLSELFNMMQSAGAALKKLFELLDTEVDVPERAGAVDLPRSGAILVDNVSFGYQPEELVLTDVTLHIDSGERLALVGPTGAGKSTLAKLVARLYEPTTGRITFGGVDLRDATNASLRERIVVVPQEGFLFNGSIRDNIRVARSGATDDEIDAALDAIGVLNRFGALADGLETEVRERGSRLSAGEKQLVSLARAALVDPAVLVLDEATSSLDPGTESLVEQAMIRLMAGRTVVVIAHRLSTAQRCDRIGVVTDGRLAEIGTHAELMDDDEHYAALFASWAGSAPVGD